MKRNVQTQIETPIHTSDIQNIIRQEVKQQLPKWHGIISDVENKLQITGFGKWVKGKRNYSLEKLVLIAQNFGVTIKLQVNDHRYELYENDRKSDD